MWNFLSLFLVILKKIFFWLQPIFGPSWWVLAKKIFLRIFIWKKHAKWYQWKKYSGIFLASVCPKEYKNGKIFDRQFFGPQEAISLSVCSQKGTAESFALTVVAGERWSGQIWSQSKKGPVKEIIKWKVSKPLALLQSCSPEWNKKKVGKKLT